MAQDTNTQKLVYQCFFDTGQTWQIEILPDTEGKWSKVTLDLAEPDHSKKKNSEIFSTPPSFTAS
jgi:hypothetical protein